MFDHVHEMSNTLHSIGIFSPKSLIPFQKSQKQKRFEEKKSLAASSALVNVTEEHIEEDDVIVK